VAGPVGGAREGGMRAVTSMKWPSGQAKEGGDASEGGDGQIR
jgi:hypothetical protein